MRSIIRPICITPGCDELSAPTNYNTPSGIPDWRKWCAKCHEKRTAGKHGLSSIGEVVAKNAGFSSYTEYLNSKHPYRNKRKNYCENIDGRLGFTCTTTIVSLAMLDVDHIDGHPDHHDESNLQTLCKCCHVYKTLKNKDYLTDGRKTLKNKKINEHQDLDFGQ